jgi:signal transduction histidine kinase
MRLSLRTRVVVAMVISAVLAVVILVVTVRTLVPPGELSRSPWDWAPADRAMCEADPEGWKAAVADVVVAFAYDPEGVSRNPAAPRLEPALLDAVRTEGIGAVDVGDTRVEARRMAAAGPCAILRVQFRAPAGLRTAIQGSIVVGAGLALVQVVGLAIFFVLQPLLRRIERLRVAATGVGSAEFAPALDDVGDALTAISTVLEVSNTRILANEAALHARQRTLERHLAEIAHDMRTPLASLLLAVQEAAVDVKGEAARKALRRALDDAESVNALVDNLHQGTRLRESLETGEGRANLVEIVERLGARFRALGQHRGVEVDAAVPEEPVWVRGSPALAERAVANLVHNAVRHGKEGGHVAIVLERTAEDFELVVVDDGPGLRPDDLADLGAATFLSDPARRRGGGLGVAITNEAARRFGWAITYAAEAPNGLRVTIRGRTEGAG